MRISSTTIPKLRLVTVIVFVFACTVFFGWLWTNSGGSIPGITQAGYEVGLAFDDVDNLQVNSDVRMAGVAVGHVAGLSTEDGIADATLSLDDGPLHEGVTIRLRPKTLLEETYVEIVDGDGAEIPEGTELDPAVVIPSVQADDILDDLDPETRAAFGDLVGSLDPATVGTADEVDRLLAGLGDLGRDGADALDILAAQGEELRAVVRETTGLLEALDTGNGRLADLVVAAQRLSDVTAANETELASTFEALPGLIGAADAAAPAIDRLSGSLAPIASSLRAAAPDLGPSLDELAATTPELRAALPELDAALGVAPETLDRVPRFGRAFETLVPPAQVALADVNPVLTYMEPYGRDVAAFFSNFSNVVGYDANGAYGRVFVIFNEQNITSLPFSSTPQVTTAGVNPYPEPGGHANPSYYEGPYPRVEEDG